MKKYITPELNALVINTADVITSSPFTVLDKGSGVDWDWSKPSVEAGL